MCIMQLCVYVRACMHFPFAYLLGAYLWPAGFVMFNWTAKGNVDFTRCKLDGGPEMPCESGLSYNVNDVTAGTHRVEVIAYCQGEPIGRETIGFRCKLLMPTTGTIIHVL